MNESAPAFEFDNITKIFGHVTANENVSFSVGEHSIHGVVGENGAGKSTIMKVLYGMYPPDGGRILFKGKPIEIENPQTAISLGIGMVHQHFMLVPTLSVWQNIILGREPTKGKLNQNAIRTALNTLQGEFGFTLDLDALVENLPVGHQQQVEILKLLYRRADILILDEPTAVLTPQEVDTLFERLRTLWKNNKTIVLISHKLREVLEFTHNITVMRQGKVIDTRKTSSLNQSLLAQLIVGRKLLSLPERKTLKDSRPVVQVNNVTVRSKGHKLKLDDVSFEVHSGEILGIAGIEGNGQTELVEVLSHVREDYEGSVSLGEVSYKESTTYGIRQAGLSVIPADRHREGVILDFSLWENLILGHHLEPEFTNGLRLAKSRIRVHCKDLLDEFDVRPRAQDLPIRALSGGNQQKAVVARELSRPVQFLVAAHPTRGVDIGAIEFIHSLFLARRDEGGAVLLISSELDEILTLADRILVLYEGKIVGETPRSQTNERQLGLWMTGVTQ